MPVAIAQKLGGVRWRELYSADTKSRDRKRPTFLTWTFLPTELAPVVFADAVPPPTADDWIEAPWRRMGPLQRALTHFDLVTAPAHGGRGAHG
jgi:hypothetical protein